MLKDKPILKTTFIIVGAGPAGLVVGIELIKAGFKAKIIEKSIKQVRTICGEYLSPQGVESLKKLGLFHIIEDFSPVWGMDLYSSYETKVATHFPNSSHGISLNREIFQSRLAREFESRGGEIYYNNQLEEIHQTTTEYIIKTSQLVLSGDYIIGADGRQSRTAKIIGINSEQTTNKRIALHCFLKPKKTLKPFGQMHILPDGSYVGINPVSPVEVNFSIVTDQVALKNAGSTKALINFWIHQRETLRSQFELIVDEEIKTTSPISRNALETVKGKVVLIGDASGFIDPLTGEGMTTAIKTADFLLEEIKRSPSIEEGFFNYGQRRRKEFLEKEKLNLGFQRLIRSSLSCEIVARILNLSERLRDTFIGVIGNVYSPKQSIKILLGLYLKERF